MFKVIQKIKKGSYFEPNNSTRGYIKFNRDIRRAGTVSAFVLILIFLFAAFPIINKTMEVEAIAGAAKASETTLTMTSGSESANLNLTPAGSSNGVFASSSSSQTAKFGVVTNNHTGYTLSISALDNNGELINTEASAALNSIANPTSADVFSTSNALNGKWGYQPSKYNSAANTNFLPAPTTNATTLDVTGSANNELNNYTIGLGARVDHTKPAGSYTNTFILTAIGNPVTYSITYADSTGDTTVANLPTFGSDPTNHTQTGSISATSINLSSTIPTRTNYTFKSWCLGAIANSGATCTGTEYSAGASFNIDQTTANTSTLYAVWNPNITIKTNTGISKVTLNGTECTSTSGCVVTGLTYGEQYTLTADISANYSFTSWNAGNNGTVVNTGSTGASTTYTVGAGPSIITPTATINKYTCTKQYRLQNADGSWGAYTTDTTEQVDYGATCSYSKTVTNYKGSSSGSNGSAATASGAMTASGLTLQVSMYRNTYTISVSNSNTTSGKSSFTVLYGGSNTVTVTPSSGYYLSSVSCPSGYTCSGYSTGTSYTGQQTITVKNNNTTNNGTLSLAGTSAGYTCNKQYRLQNADGTYPSSYTSDGSTTVAGGNTCTYSKTVSGYQTKSTSGGPSSGNITLSLDLPRQTYKVALYTNTGISSVTGSGTYRWGQTITISAELKSGYRFDGWSCMATVGVYVCGDFSTSYFRITEYIVPQGDSFIEAKAIVDDGGSYIF